MPNPYFRFKQFIVFHDRCAMKVGTDGVILGAWADCKGANTILDIGTGSGLIALMVAQRSRAVIDAIDLNEEAVEQARDNFAASPFAERLRAYRISLQNFCPERKYDLIVSNPPYFSASLKTPDPHRTAARHDESLTPEELLDYAVSLLSETGRIALIYPADNFERITSAAMNRGLFLSRKTLVSPTPQLPPKRVLLEYSQIETMCSEEKFHIETARHQYSEEYIRLTGDFYLNL